MKKFNAWIVPLILAASAVLFVSGVVKKYWKRGESDIREIAVIPQGVSDIWWQVVREGAEAAARKYGAKVIWTGPEQESDRERQVQILKDVVVKKVAAIVVAPNSEIAGVRALEEGADKGIPFVVIDSSLASKRNVSYIATNSYKAGAQAARVMAKLLNGRGKVIIQCNLQSNRATSARHEGFIDELKKNFPDVKVVDMQYSDGTAEGARQRTADMLMRFPDTDGVYAVNHMSSVGALNGIEASGKAGKVKFIAFDSDALLVKGITDGSVHAIMVQNPFQIGYNGVEQAIFALDGKQVTKNIDVPCLIVDKENLAEMRKNYARAMGLNDE